MNFAELMATLPDFLDDLKSEGFRIDIGHYALSQELLLRLFSYGALPEDPRRLKTLLAPLLCSSPSEQDQFDERFGIWLSGIKAETINAHTSEAKNHVSESSLDEQLSKLERITSWRNVALACLTSIAFVCLLFFSLMQHLRMLIGQITPGRVVR